MAVGVQNIYGRRWGRGLRPWLILPKYVCVSLFIGGLGAAGVVLTSPSEGPTAVYHAELFGRLFTRAIVPGLVGAIVLGILLLLIHPWAFFRMRWFQLKLALIAVGVPGLHLYMRGRSLAWKAALRAGDFAAADGIRRELLAGLGVAVIFGVVIAILGRIKPRLGQDYARTFSRQTNQQ